MFRNWFQVYILPHKSRGFWTFILFWYTSLDVCKKRKRRIGELPRFFSLVTQCMISRKEKKRKVHANFHILWPNLGGHVIQLAKILFFNFHFKTVRNDIQTMLKNIIHRRIQFPNYFLNYYSFPDSQTWYFILHPLRRRREPTTPCDWFRLTWLAKPNPSLPMLLLRRPWKDPGKSEEEEPIFLFFFFFFSWFSSAKVSRRRKEDPKEEDVDRQQ